MLFRPCSATLGDDNFFHGATTSVFLDRRIWSSASFTLQRRDFWTFSSVRFFLHYPFRSSNCPPCMVLTEFWKRPLLVVPKTTSFDLLVLEYASLEFFQCLVLSEVLNRCRSPHSRFSFPTLEDGTPRGIKRGIGGTMSLVT